MLNHHVLAGLHCFGPKFRISTVKRSMFVLLYTKYCIHSQLQYSFITEQVPISVFYNSLPQCSLLSLKKIYIGSSYLTFRAMSRRAKSFATLPTIELVPV